jgi:hypothetical protein
MVPRFHEPQNGRYEHQGVERQNSSSHVHLAPWGLDPSRSVKGEPSWVDEGSSSCALVKADFPHPGQLTPIRTAMKRMPSVAGSPIPSMAGRRYTTLGKVNGWSAPSNVVELRNRHASAVCLRLNQ